MRRPLLPLGSLAPWVLAGCALLLAAAGLFTENREMVVLGVVAAATLIVAFPLARFLLGKDDDTDN
ncbi:MAG: hypothetical protein ABI577_00400 [bacterium]